MLREDVSWIFFRVNLRKLELSSCRGKWFSCLSVVLCWIIYLSGNNRWNTVVKICYQEDDDQKETFYVLFNTAARSDNDMLPRVFFDCQIF